MYQKFEIVSFETYKSQYFNKLKKPSCVIKCIEELCGGWTQETLKQNIQKLTKKNQAPLPLFFDSPDSMDAFSIKKAALANVYIAFDTRGIGRIDATELYSVMMFLSKGEISMIFQHIVEIFGQDKATYITSDEFFFFLDCLFRGLSKILVRNNDDKPFQVNKRLQADDIKQFISSIFKGQSQLLKEELYEKVNFVQQLNQRISLCISTSNSKIQWNILEEFLKNMKLTLEVKKLMGYLLSEVDKKLKPPGQEKKK